MMHVITTGATVRLSPEAPIPLPHWGVLSELYLPFRQYRQSVIPSEQRGDDSMAALMRRASGHVIVALDSSVSFARVVGTLYTGWSIGTPS